MNSDKKQIRFDGKEVCVLDKWKVRVGVRIGQSGHLLFTYRNCNQTLEPIGDPLKYKCKKVGVIVDSLVKKEGDLVVPNDVLIEYTECLHNTVMKDLCADCGANINSLDDSQRKRIAELTSISMVHSVPELRVSKERAETLGRADEQRLLGDRKLVLLVDLDQTIIHSTNHNVPQDMASVHHFQLYGSHTQWYHTKFRPHTMEFLKSMSKYFELHICTFGARRYAHTIAHLLDPKEEYFPKDRILSRDECFDPNLKTGNMKSLFPCGDSLVCIIDDREDVWNYASNLIAVKPYICFRDTGDINAPERSLNQLYDIQDILLTDKTDALKEFTKKEEINDKQIDETTDKTNICDESSIELIESIDKNDEQIVRETKKIEEINENKVIEKENSIITENALNCVSNERQTDENKTEDCVPTTSDSKSTTEDNSDPKKSESDSNSSDVIIDANSDDKKTTIDSKEVNEKRKQLIDDNDDYLLYLEEILTRIHSEYYKEYDEKMRYKSEDEEIKLPDLKEVIPRVRKCVLRGVNIVFSGVIPTNILPEKNKLFNIAKNFGANVTPDLVLEGSPKTTHLVAAKWGTVKVNKCIKSKNIFIVNPNWLYCCSERWERVDERLYPLEKEVLSTEKEKLFDKRSKEQNTVKGSNVLITKPKGVVPYATYDPKTGKRIRSESQTQKTFLDTNSDVELKRSQTDSNLEKSRQIQPHNMIEFSPLSGFSSNELQSMGKEVDDACSEGDELSTGNTDSDSDIDVEDLKDIKSDKRQIVSSSEDSNDGECPKGWNKNKRTKNFDGRRLLELEEVNDSTRDSLDFDNRRNIDDESTDNESIGSVDEEMALAVEREFLS